ncbi:MAG: XRE family transcriptional regulator [Oscillospiraceae bacterium]|nr:XRE family transcriptional regulator [Oscillospiraceae bacterium]
MIGNMLTKIRKEKGMTKTELSALTGINIGHLTHIEKGERNPSHKALRKLCKALDVPYQQLMYTYDKSVSEEQAKYGVVNYIPYNKVLAVDNINKLIDCPSNVHSASIAIKVIDDSMKNTFPKNSYVFVEFNSPLNNKDFGTFSYNNEILIRKFTIKKDIITLKADNPEYNDIIVNHNDPFYIIGKIIK